MLRFNAGQLVNVAISIADSSGNAIDPTGLTVPYSVQAKGVTTDYVLTYPSSTLTRLAQGSFLAVLDTTGLPGLWTVASKSSGTGKDYEFTTFQVMPAPV